MTRKFFSGNNLEQAVMMAARHYELEPSELAYSQLEKKHGFLRTRKSVMIVVDPEKPRREPGSAGEPRPERGEAPRAAAHEPETRSHESAAEPPDAPSAWAHEEQVADDESEAWAADKPEADDKTAVDDEPAAWAQDERDTGAEPEAWSEDAPEAAVERQEWSARESGAAVEDEPPAPPAASERPSYREAELRDVAGDEELLEAAEEASQILLQFAGIEAEAKARAAGERVEVEIDGPDDSVLVVEGGKGLLSIQHLLPRMLRGLTGRSSFVRVDSGEFHKQRKERLEALALKEADAASRDRRPRTLPPMAPDERRIVHMALKDSPTVVTESRGTGLHKRVVIRPADDFNEPGDIEARHGF